MKKIKMMAVFTVIALATSFAGHAQTAKPATATKTPASKDQTVAPAKQTQSSSTTTSTTASKPATAKKTHKPGTTTAKKGTTAKPKATVAPSNHFARSYSNAGVMKGKHKKGHHKAAKAPTGDGK